VTLPLLSRTTCSSINFNFASIDKCGTANDAAFRSSLWLSLIRMAAAAASSCDVIIFIFALHWSDAAAAESEK